MPGCRLTGFLGRLTYFLAAVFELALAALPRAWSSDVNVALGRPCEPEPSCPTLVDGNLSAFRPARLRGRHRDGNNDLPNFTAGLTVSEEDHYLNGRQGPSVTFRVFLQEPAFVTHVIIYSTPAAGGNISTGGPRRRKLVVTWAEEEDSSGKSSESGKVVEINTRRSEIVASGTEAERQSLSFPYTYALQVGHKASSIALAWGVAIDEGHGTEEQKGEQAQRLADGVEGDGTECTSFMSECDGFQVTEIEVMASQPGDEEEGALPALSLSEKLLLFPGPDEHDVNMSKLDTEVTASTDLGEEKPLSGQSSSSVANASTGNLENTTSGLQALSESSFSTTVAAHVQGSANLRIAAFTAQEQEHAPSEQREQGHRVSGPKAMRMAWQQHASTKAPTTMAPGSPPLTSGSESHHVSDPKAVRAAEQPQNAIKAPTTMAPGSPLLTWGSESISDYDTSIAVEMRGSNGFLAPSSSSELAPPKTGIVMFLPVLAWISILALFALVAPKCWQHRKGNDEAYIRLPDEDTEALLNQSELVVEQRLSSGSRRGAQHGHGSAVDPMLSSSNVSSPDRSRSPSPAPSIRTQRSATETEPEGELDPCSCLPPTQAERFDISTPPSSPRASDLTSAPDATPALETMQISAATPGRVTLLFSSPLCHLDKERGPVPMQALPFEREWGMLRQAYHVAAAALNEASQIIQGAGARNSWQQPAVSLGAHVLTAGSLQRALAPVSSGAAASVLHLSAHGTQDCLVLEEPDRPLTAHLLSCDMLRDMLDLRDRFADQRKGGLRLVILNVCGARKIGTQFAQGGIPHVICSSATLRDSAGQAFLKVLYSNLFQGSSVVGAFDAARVALRGDADASIRASAEHFCLLPEGSFRHDEVLFPPEVRQSSPYTEDRPFLARWRRRVASTYSSSSGPIVDLTSDDLNPEGSDSIAEAGSSGDGGNHRSGARRSRLTPLARRRKRAAVGAPIALPSMVYSPFTRITPDLPEDFSGRTLDTWIVLQHLTSRRAVVVCSEEGEDHGVGKSAVLDAVHRAYTLQVGGVCISARLRAPELMDEPGGLCNSWVAEVQEAVRRTIRECRELWWPAAADAGRPLSSTRTSRPRVGGGGASARQAWYRGRPVSRGFHPLSGAVAAAAALADLTADLAKLAELCAARRREWPAASDQILLLVDQCDHLIQQQYFQNAIADLLQSCAAYRIVLSTHQRMVGTAGGRFKVTHHAVRGLTPREAGRLVLRRAQRPIRWEELLPAVAPVGNGTDDTASSPTVPAGSPLAAAMASAGAQRVVEPVVLTRGNEAEVFDLVGRHPAVATLNGNPKCLIELASRLSPGFASLAHAVGAVEAARGQDCTSSAVTPPRPRQQQLPPSAAGQGDCSVDGQVRRNPPHSEPATKRHRQLGGGSADSDDDRRSGRCPDAGETEPLLMDDGAAAD
mmetsp:Transcript_35444/g.93467  ORF Transcript_35444/g.93467 Transcript_35444/m.93467 type:complete len:1427 (-) Transcript_35444:86-4366(-)